MATKDVDFW